MLDNYHQIDMASRTTNYAEIQQDELEVLRSIYMEDFEEEAVKTGAWNVCGSALEEHQLLCLSSPESRRSL